MKISQLVSLDEAQTAALFKPKATPTSGNFSAQPPGYSKVTTTVKPPQTTQTAAPAQKTISVPTSTPGAYAVKGFTGQQSTQQSAPQEPAGAPGTITNKVNPADQASAQPAEKPATTQQTAPQEPAEKPTAPAKQSTGIGNIASNVVGGVAQTLGAAKGGWDRGVNTARSGQKFTSPQSQNQPNALSAGDSELADLRARLDSIEQLIRSKS